MSTDGDSGPFRAIGGVIAAFVFAFVFVLVVIQFGGVAAGNVLWLPVVVLVPIVLALLWYRIKHVD